MTRPLTDDELAELALGTLPAAHRAALSRDLGPATLASAEAEAAEALTSLAVALPPATPSPGLRDRLLASARGPARFAPFIDRLARMVDLAGERVQALLASLTPRPSGPDLADRGTWQPSPAPHIHLVHFDGGPACAGADVGFVRVDAGTTFPDHRHVGEETVLVLQGSYRDSDGTLVRAGDIVKKSADSHHHFTAGPDEPLIYAVVVFGGIEIPGVSPDTWR